MTTDVARLQDDVERMLRARDATIEQQWQMIQALTADARRISAREHAALNDNHRLKVALLEAELEVAALRLALGRPGALKVPSDVLTRSTLRSPPDPWNPNSGWRD